MAAKTNSGSMSCYRLARVGNGSIGWSILVGTECRCIQLWTLFYGTCRFYHIVHTFFSSYIRHFDGDKIDENVRCRRGRDVAGPRGMLQRRRRRLRPHIAKIKRKSID